jgi:PiT family inorganic phosphate transporter
MDVTMISLVGLVGLALLFDYTNGFHDSANSIATVVATRVLRPRLAVIWVTSAWHLRNPDQSRSTE